MGSKARISSRIIEQVWLLNNNGMHPDKIAEKLKISKTSVLRCIFAMQQAASGRFVQYVGLLRDSHHIADYANKRFNVVDNSQTDLEPEDLLVALDRLTKEISRQNSIFEVFIKKLENRV